MISLCAASCPSGLCDVLDSDILELLHAVAAIVGFRIELEEQEEGEQKHLFKYRPWTELIQIVLIGSGVLPRPKCDWFGV
jgi:hypothetical protein